MRPSTPGAHCLGVGCDHDSAASAAHAHPAAPLRGRRARSGRHTRTAAVATTGRRSARP